MTILGGLMGFVVSMGFGLIQEGSWPTLLGRACVAALIAAGLLRWWSQLWSQQLQEASRQRQEQTRLVAEPSTETKMKPATARSIAATHKP